MDLLRSTIESFFYRLPIEAIAECIVNEDKEAMVPDLFNEIVTHENHSFTYPEMSLLGDMLDSEWIVDDEFKISVSNTSFLCRTPLLLHYFSKNALRCNNLSNPLVRFNQLLRWRTLTLLLGEDQFTIPFLARFDLSHRLTRTDFCWPNILEHDNFRLNIFLRETLSDTHSHINAALDVFEFNWIARMNNPISLTDKESQRDFFNDGTRLGYDAVRHFSQINLNLGAWTIIAAALRILIFRHLKNEQRQEDKENIANAISDPGSFSDICTSTMNDIGLLQTEALKLNIDSPMPIEYAFDYAIPQDFEHFNETMLSSPFMVHFGERYLLYRWFRGYYGNDGDTRTLTPYMLLYLLIKAKVRREYIQSNELVGFRNFKNYQDRKTNFYDFQTVDMRRVYGQIAYRYAVQSSLGLKPYNNVEARITPGVIKKFRDIDICRNIFKGGRSIGDDAIRNITFVAHFIKKPDSGDPYRTNCRHQKVRENLWKDVAEVVEAYRRNGNPEYPDLTGIDAAADELACRPEVFAPMFRYARHCGINHFTYHAGEDFYDIVDGLRTICEAIDFFRYSMGDRIGHGLALGTDPSTFYSERHLLLMIPRQILLDNLVWLKYEAGNAHISLSSDTLLFIEKYFNTLARELGYIDISPNPYEYYLSMKLRGDIMEEDIIPLTDFTDEVRYTNPDWSLAEKESIIPLWHHYEKNPECRIKGKRPIAMTVPESYAADIAQLQETILSNLEHEGIVIETNPSSNLKIGRFSRYDQHPITHFNSVIPSPDRHSIVVTVNTDDKGVFSTSLTNEFSLLAIALKKQKNTNGNRLYSEGQIEDYLHRLAAYGNVTRFMN